MDAYIWWVVSACVLALVAIFSENLRTLLDITVTGWSLRRQGVSDDEIHKIVLAKARRQRRNLVLQALGLIIKPGAEK